MFSPVTKLVVKFIWMAKPHLLTPKFQKVAILAPYLRKWQFWPFSSQNCWEDATCPKIVEKMLNPTSLSVSMEPCIYDSRISDSFSLQNNLFSLERNLNFSIFTSISSSMWLFRSFSPITKLVVKFIWIAKLHFLTPKFQKVAILAPYLRKWQFWPFSSQNCWEDAQSDEFISIDGTLYLRFTNQWFVLSPKQSIFFGKKP